MQPEPMNLLQTHRNGGWTLTALPQVVQYHNQKTSRRLAIPKSLYLILKLDPCVANWAACSSRMVAREPLVDAVRVETVEAGENAQLVTCAVVLAADRAFRLIWAAAVLDHSGGEPRQFSLRWLVRSCVTDPLAKRHQLLIAHSVYVRKRHWIVRGHRITKNSRYQPVVVAASKLLFLPEKSHGQGFVVQQPSSTFGPGSTSRSLHDAMPS